MIDRWEDEKKERGGKEKALFEKIITLPKLNYDFNAFNELIDMKIKDSLPLIIGNHLNVIIEQNEREREQRRTKEKKEKESRRKMKEEKSKSSMGSPYNNSCWHG